MKTNQKEETEETEKEIELAEEIAKVCGERVVYSLLFRKENRDRFALRVRMRGEQTEAALGSDWFFAAEAFRKVVQGSVTPCTVEEVLADLRYESIFLKTPLQERNFMVE